MTIETLYRVQCGGGCERYLPGAEYPVPGAVVTVNSSDADLFLTFSSAYDEAVRRGWTAYPLVCPDCAKDLHDKAVTRVETRPGQHPPENGGGVPESRQSAERAATTRRGSGSP